MKCYIKYLVLQNGNVFSLIDNNKRLRKKPFLMKPSTDKNGYKYYKLVVDGKYKHVRRGRLVATMYLENPSNKPTVNHKNGIKDDDNVKNLEWATYSENEKHSYLVLGKKPNKPMQGKVGSKMHNSKKVIASKDGIDIKELFFESTRLAGMHFGLSGHEAIARAARQGKKSCGYNWRYL